MLPEGSIRADHVWKRFLPDRKGKMLRLEYERMRARLGGKPLDWHWALADVDLAVDPGESLGLVGSNGSGKSTLLKVLCRVMYPYAGSVDVAGRVGALIEVRAGINIDLTGRENIHLYGTLLGLKRSEVARRFDDIVEFAQLEMAIDRQVKYYSSGMQMRLGFAVAAYLEPAILLVDEVLAVGDAAFQQRCLERMRVVLEQGTTVIFVSHDLASVQSICTRGVWLHDGEVQVDGPVADALTAYRTFVDQQSVDTSFKAAEGVVRLANINVGNPSGELARPQEPLEITVQLESDIVRTDTSLYLGVTEGTPDPIFALRRMTALAEGVTEIRCVLPRLPLPQGRFSIWASVTDDRTGGHELMRWQPIAHVDVYGPNLDKVPKAVVRRAPVHVEAHWDTVENASKLSTPGATTRAG